MAKKTEDVKQGCLGVTCGDSTCLACQVAQADRHHAEQLAALTLIAGNLALLVSTIATAPLASRDSGSVPQTNTPAAPSGTTPAAPAAPAAPAKALTVDAVRPVVLDWIKANGRDKFVAVLGKFGASKLPDVKDADLPRLLDELKVAAGA